MKGRKGLLCRLLGMVDGLVDASYAPKGGKKENWRKLGEKEKEKTYMYIVNSSLTCMHVFFYN